MYDVVHNIMVVKKSCMIENIGVYAQCWEERRCHVTIRENLFHVCVTCAKCNGGKKGIRE